ncbi:MAG: RagB/SusD family nutrient uptake outer membrane protein [Alistipes sp.]|jgi:hypothetical protein|nr:RagB/SusD family nutrient uptake outer membrane protein [Alistipes sp.]
MKKIFLVFSLAGLLLTGCENFLDTDNLTQKDTSNYPVDAEEMSALLTGVYSAAQAMELDPTSICQFVVAEIMSDERFGGGGPDDAVWADLERFDNTTNPNFFANTWSNAYSTIFRANMLLRAIDTIEWEEQGTRDYIAGQAHFMRGYAFLYLARMFGTAPMPLTPDPVNLPRASADELFGQIGSDFLAAIDLMPETPRVAAADRGRATKWAAEAFLGRAFLFYTGYYKKESMPLAAAEEGAEAGTLTKAEVIGHLEDCINNSGHDLLPRFESLWPYSNQYTREDGYAWLDSVDPDGEAVWAGETGGNIETVFAFQPLANIGWDYEGGNMIPLYFSLREQGEAGIFPYGKGWGFGPVSSELWNSWPNTDPRREGSIIDVNNKDEMSDFKWGADNQQHETGFYQKKYLAVNVKDEDGSLGSREGYISYSRPFYGPTVPPEFELGNTQDLVTMRFADVLLMAAELKGDAAPLNRVRARVGLPEVAYSEKALQDERRWELAFEGQRYYDLLRWGIAAPALERQNGVAIQNATVPTTMNVGDQTGRLAETGGFMPVPNSEVELSAGVLTQTPGW